MKCTQCQRPVYEEYDTPALCSSCIIINAYESGDAEFASVGHACMWSNRLGLPINYDVVVGSARVRLSNFASSPYAERRFDVEFKITDPADGQNRYLRYKKLLTAEQANLLVAKLSEHRTKTLTVNCSLWTVEI